METNVIFDTHACVKRMTEAGVEPHVAEAFAAEQVRILENHIATKTDIEQLRAATKSEIEQLRAATQRDIERSKNDLTWRVIGLFIVFSGIIVTGFFAALQMYLP